MKKTMMKKSFSVISITLLILFIAGVSMSFAGKVTKSQNKSIQGTVVNIITEKGRIEVQNEAGKIVAFTAGPETDLTIFKKGDQVLIVYGKDQVIQSILKQG